MSESNCIVVKAKTLENGQPFRKMTGKRVYIKINSSGLDYIEDYCVDPIFGVCFKGNTVKIKPDTKVVLMHLEDMFENKK
jgi:hypothetical protein